MTHLDEEIIAQHAAGLLAGDARQLAHDHLATCESCRDTFVAYQRISAALSLPGASRQTIERVKEMTRQRVRLTQFIHRLVSDPGWRAEVQRDPEVALERHRIRPTPQLVAALKELSPVQEQVDGSQLDERISKLLPPI